MNKNELGGACSTLAARRGAYRVLVEKPEGKRSLGRPRCRWKMDLQDAGWGAWTRFVWLRTGTGGGLLWVQ